MSEKNKALSKLAESAVAKKFAAQKRLFILIAAAVVVIVIALILFITGIGLASDKASEIYESRKNEQKDTTVSAFLNTVHQTIESKYHVSNDVKINIEFTEDVSRLEVLCVYDTEYVINDDGNTAIWTEIPASGIFTVDLEHAEIITDAQSGSVIVNVFKPELTSFGIDYANTNVFFGANSSILPWDNGSVKLGEDIARKNLAEAHSTIRSRMLNEPKYYEVAEKNAKEMIADLLNSLNPEQELKIDVEFIDLDK